MQSRGFGYTIFRQTHLIYIHTKCTNEQSTWTCSDKLTSRQDLFHFRASDVDIRQFLITTITSICFSIPCLVLEEKSPVLGVFFRTHPWSFFSDKGCDFRYILYPYTLSSLSIISCLKASKEHISCWLWLVFVNICPTQLAGCLFTPHVWSSGYGLRNSA